MDTAAAKIICESLRLEKELVLDFFCVFSRFEYALKRAGFAKRREGVVAAHWPRFAQSLQARFDENRTPKLKEAVDFLRSYPPQTQTIDRDGLGWRDTPKGPTEGELEWLLRLIRTARNNLFHGGKSPEWLQAEPDREIRLLRSCLVILESCLDFSPQLKHYFEDGLRP